jgi:hypothetical protein
MPCPTATTRSELGCSGPVVSRIVAPRNSSRTRRPPRDKRPRPLAAPSARLTTKPLVAAMAAMGHKSALHRKKARGACTASRSALRFRRLRVHWDTDPEDSLALRSDDRTVDPVGSRRGWRQGGIAGLRATPTPKGHSVGERKSAPSAARPPLRGICSTTGVVAPGQGISRGKCAGSNVVKRDLSPRCGLVLDGRSIQVRVPATPRRPAAVAGTGRPSPASFASPSGWPGRSLPTRRTARPPARLP